MTTIEQYIKAKQDLELFVDANKKVLLDFDKLNEYSKELEEQLKNEAKENKSDIEAGQWKFQFIQRYKKSINYFTAIDCMETQEQREKLIDITALKREVDMDKFIELCRAGVLPDRARIEALEEEELSPQVRLTKNKV